MQDLAVSAMMKHVQTSETGQGAVKDEFTWAKLKHLLNIYFKRLQASKLAKHGQLDCTVFAV